jgi:predicted acyl esterase
MFGKSYDGWTLAMALADRPKGLGAVVIQAPIVSGYRSLYMNGVHYSLGWYATPALYQSTDALPPTVFDSPQYILHSALGLNPLCYALNIALQTGFADRDDRDGFWNERDLIARAAGSTVPTFWEHGFLDANAKPDNFLDVYSQLRGPRRVWAGQWQHDRPTEALVGRGGFYSEAMRWFDRYVKGEAPTVDDPGAEIEDGGTQTWRAETQWPPDDASVHELAVRGARWSVSPQLPHDVHLAGTPRLSVDARSTGGRAYVYSRLYDIDADGKAVLLTRGASAITRNGRLAFDLYPQDWTFRAGHRIGLELPPSDSWFLPLPTLGNGRASSGSLALPFLRYKRSSTLPGGPTKVEKERPAPPDVSAAIAGAETAFDVPPALTDPPPAASRLTAKLRRLDRRRVRVSGRAPVGMRLRVRIVSGKRTLATRHVTVGPRGTWRLTVRIAHRPGRTLRARVAADR